MFTHVYLGVFASQAIVIWNSIRLEECEKRGDFVDFVSRSSGESGPDDSFRWLF